jgi:hypothetical protein
MSKVKEIWIAPTRDTRSLDKVLLKLMDKVLLKLKKVKKFFKGWGFNLAGNRKKGRMR